jgi:hypothetical protein
MQFNDVVDIMSVRMSITIYLSFVQSEEVKEPTTNNVEELNVQKAQQRRSIE